MNKKFEILSVDSNEYPFIVFSLDKTRLDDYLLEVGNKLRKKSCKGMIIFDLLLTNGSDDRYYTICFNGESFDFASIQTLKTPSKDITEISKKFYTKNADFIDNSILNSAQKYLLKKELTHDLH